MLGSSVECITVKSARDTQSYSAGDAPWLPNEANRAACCDNSGQAIMPTRMGPGNWLMVRLRASTALRTPLNADRVTSSSAAELSSREDSDTLPHLRCSIWAKP